jgi:hypothetical protein
MVLLTLSLFSLANALMFNNVSGIIVDAISGFGSVSVLGRPTLFAMVISFSAI